MTKILHIIERKEDGYEIQVARIDAGYSVTIRDTDCDEFLDVARIFRTESAALDFARTC